MASRFARASARANRMMMDRLSDGLCTYHPANGDDINDVPYQFDNSVETIDKQGVGRFVRAVLLPKDRVVECSRADVITINGKQWRYNGTLSDDGAFVQIEVT